MTGCCFSALEDVFPSQVWLWVRRGWICLPPNSNGRRRRGMALVLMASISCFSSSSGPYDAHPTRRICSMRLWKKTSQEPCHSTRWGIVAWYVGTENPYMPFGDAIRVQIGKHFAELCLSGISFFMTRNSHRKKGHRDRRRILGNWLGCHGWRSL